MAKFIYTYGSDERFPFQSGWTEVAAPTREKADALFRSFHPDRKGSDCLNCAFVYTDAEFARTCMADGKSPQGRCRESISLMGNDSVLCLRHEVPA